MLRGIYHSHSIYSYDGKKQLDEIADWAQINSFNFVILTEHDIGFTEKKFNEFSTKCKEFINITFIPGIEYSFKSDKGPIHISVIGIDRFLDINQRPVNICDFLQKIKTFGGISILNHPFRIIDQLNQECFELLDFIESWNLVYDVKYSPNNKIKKYSTENGFQGKYLASSDVHRFRKKDRYPFIEIQETVRNKCELTIINGLMSGDYRLLTRFWRNYPDGTFSPVFSVFKVLPIISLKHQYYYEQIRIYYYQKIRSAPPKWLVKILK